METVFIVVLKKFAVGGIFHRVYRNKGEAEEYAQLLNRQEHNPPVEEGDYFEVEERLLF